MCAKVRVVVPTELRLASVRRRLLASLIDAVILGIPVLALIVAGVWLYARHTGRQDPGHTGPTLPSLRRRWQLSIWAVGAVLQVQGRNWRSPGYRVVGLRRVEARTGGPVSLRSGLINVLVATAWSRSTRVLLRRVETRQKQRLAAVDAEIKAAQDAHRDDPEAARRAITEIYKRHRLNPLRSCLPAIASTLVLQLPAFWSPRNQTVPERLTGTVVINE